MENPSYLGDWPEELERAQAAEIVILGPSTAQHIYPEAMCLNGISLAGQGQDVMEAEALIAHMADAGTLPQTVILAQPPTHYFLDNGSDGTNRRHRRITAYRTLQGRDDWRLIGEDWQGALRSIAFPALGYREWAGRFRSAASDSSDLSLGASDPAFSTAIVESEEQDIELALDFFSRKETEFARLRQFDDKTPDRSLAAVSRISKMVSAAGSRFVQVSMPVGKAVSERIEARMADEMSTSRKIDAAIAEQQVLQINDLGGHPITNDLTSFRDSIHLNWQGGMRYSRDLAERLAIWGVIARPECEAPRYPMAARSRQLRTSRQPSSSTS
jgi:hypothetical protein